MGCVAVFVARARRLRRQHPASLEAHGQVAAEDARLDGLHLAADVRLAVQQVALRVGAGKRGRRSVRGRQVRAPALATGHSTARFAPRFFARLATARPRGKLRFRCARTLWKVSCCDTCLLGQTMPLLKACTMSSCSHNVPLPLRSTCIAATHTRARPKRTTCPCSWAEVATAPTLRGRRHPAARPAPACLRLVRLGSYTQCPRWRSFLPASPRRAAWG